jgi:hypothetical protein
MWKVEIKRLRDGYSSYTSKYSNYLWNYQNKWFRILENGNSNNKNIKNVENTIIEMIGSLENIKKYTN